MTPSGGHRRGQVSGRGQHRHCRDNRRHAHNAHHHSHAVHSTLHCTATQLRSGDGRPNWFPRVRADTQQRSTAWPYACQHGRTDDPVSAVAETQRRSTPNARFICCRYHQLQQRTVCVYSALVRHCSLSISRGRKQSCVCGVCRVGGAVCSSRATRRPRRGRRDCSGEEDSAQACERRSGARVQRQVDARRIGSRTCGAVECRGAAPQRHPTIHTAYELGAFPIPRGRVVVDPTFYDSCHLV